MKKLWVLSIVTAFALSVVSLMPPTTSGHQDKFRQSVDPVPGKYIVVLNEKYTESDASHPVVEAEANFLTSVYGGQVSEVYESALKGYAVQMSEAEAISLSEDDRVLFVEEDAYITASTTQNGAPWHLDRIDQRNLPLSTDFTYNSTGAGVHAYVLDTGIRATHTDFGGRASVAYDAIGDGQNGFDCQGHGTHVAGLLGSSTYGVAKDVTIHAVRVLPCVGSGTSSSLISGINWVTANRINPAVANISINAGGISSSVDSAVNNSIASGVTYAISAGNNGGDACNFSPASVTNAIVVGVTNSDDVRVGYSNYGACVDVHAPGYNVLSLSNASDVDLRWMGGTSMASPVTAGIAALYLSANPTASPATVAQAIRNSATIGVLSNVDATPTTTANRLVHSSFGTVPGPTPVPSPTATPTPTPTATPTPTPTPTPNARITVKKRANNGGGGGGGTSSTATFPYAATNLSASSFALVDNTQFVDANVNQGQVIVSEAPVMGWALTSIQCVETSTGLPNSQNTTVDVSNRRANIIAEAGEDVTCTFTSEPIAPTAARVSVSGRVSDADGFGIRGATVYIYNANGTNYRTANTNSFGYYTFTDLAVGEVYVLGLAQVRRRARLEDNTRSFTLNDNLAGMDFVLPRL